MAKSQIQWDKYRSDPEACVLQKDVFDGQRQQAGKKISLAEAALQQNHRQGSG